MPRTIPKEIKEKARGFVMLLSIMKILSKSSHLRSGITKPMCPEILLASILDVARLSEFQVL